FSRFRPAAPTPHPKKIGFARYMMEVGKNPLGAFAEEAFEQRYIYAELLHLKSILVNDPESVKRVLLDNAANYPKSTQFIKMIVPALGNSMLTTEGAEWRFQRRTAAPMCQMRHIGELAPGMVAAANDMLARWRGLEEVDIAQEMMRLTYDVISRTMFSNDVSLPFDKMA